MTVSSSFTSLLSFLSVVGKEGDVQSQACGGTGSQWLVELFQCQEEAKKHVPLPLLTFSINLLLCPWTVVAKIHMESP